MGAKGEGGSEKGPPQRDKVANQGVKFDKGAGLSDRLQLKVLELPKQNNDRFAAPMRC